MSASLIGSIVERKPTPSKPFNAPDVPESGKTGFPPVQHRSKSAFARAREDQKRPAGSERPQAAPKVVSVAQTKRERSLSDGEDGVTQQPDEAWRKQIEEENKRKVEGMTPEVIEQERKEILDRFGPGIEEVLRKARAAREAARLQEGPSSERPSASKKPLRSALVSRPTSPDPGSPSSTRPPSRSDKRLRFAELTSRDVHVYDSAPPSPKRKPLALVSPTEADGPTISLGEWKGRMKGLTPLPPPSASKPATSSTVGRPSINDELLEGTPEDIRRRFFPNAAPHDPSLAWIEGSDEPSPKDASALRFDFTGAPIPANLSATLPTYLGLHHHAEGTHAGYTLEDIFLLSRSTVPAQRASMLDILGRIARRLSRNVKGKPNGIPELRGQESALRKRILAAGVEAMAERATVGARAAEVMHICLVVWDEDTADIDDVELKGATNDVYSSLPVEYILQRCTEAFSTGDLPRESLTQLLGVIRRLAQESNVTADTIVSSPNLVSSILSRFVLTPIPPNDPADYPEPLALQTLNTLAMASRDAASTLSREADSLLRFVVTLPHSSPYPAALATTLLTSTFQFYRTLASYGLRTSLSATAFDALRGIMNYTLDEQCTSAPLQRAWLALLETWMTCAQDPHRTTPPHDIIWSQVVGWDWGDEILGLRDRLHVDDAETWAALWTAEAAWLEGCRVNGVQAGGVEKATALSRMKSGFAEGPEAQVLVATGTRLEEALKTISLETFKIEQWQELAKLSRVLSAALRLWISCLPSLSTPPESPPFNLPFSSISAICAKIAAHPLWSALHEGRVPYHSYTYARPVSRLLAAYLDLSRLLPGSVQDLWMAQAFCILQRLIPGDEETSVRIIQDLSRLISPQFAQQRGWVVPSAIWEKNGMDPIIPFLTRALRHNETYVGPTWATPASVSGSTTQRLPARAPESRSEGKLPLSRDWVFTPLDHLLRSGQSEVFKSLPSTWDASETEVTRATLLLAKVQREVLRAHGLLAFMPSREEVVFACMKVFMLEHEQQDTSSAEEVFRDDVVGHFMNDLIAPLTIAASATVEPKDAASASDSLEVAAKGFLGPSTPFYQYYTDFVSLYDAISFSHPLFARLLLPPLSMRYDPDYRKYLWGDYGHVLRTIKTPVGDVIAANVEEFLWPVETSGEILSAYLRALVKGQVEQFLYLVAVHHIACNIWPDLNDEDEDEFDEEKAVRLLQAVVDQSGFAVIRAVVTYQQRKHAAVLPPECFAASVSVKFSRWHFVVRSGLVDLQDRLAGLLQ